MSHRHHLSAKILRLLQPVLTSVAICAGIPAIGAAGTLIGESSDAGSRLRATLESTLLRQVTERYPNDEVAVEVLPINPAVLNKQCNAPTITVTGQRLAGRLSVHIKCGAPQTWAFYASANVAVRTLVTVPSRNILRGELITTSMLVREKRDLDRLRQGYLKSAEDIVGRKASRSLRSQQPIYPHQIAVPHAVVSGDQVQIVAQRRTISISSAEIALEDGHVGDQIRVRNSASERLLNLWVWDNGVVGTQPRRVRRGG